MYFLDMDKRAEGLFSTNFDSKREVNSILYFRMQYFFFIEERLVVISDFAT